MVRKILATAIIVFLFSALWISTWGAGNAQAMTADCTKLKLSRPVASLSNGKPRINFTVSNKGSNTYIQNISFNWEAYHALRPSQLLQRWRYDGVAIHNMTDINALPYTWKKPNTELLQGESDAFSFEFAFPDAGWPGNLPATAFGLEVLLGNGCTLAFQPITSATPTATPTITPTIITSTPTTTRTITVTPNITTTGTPTPLCIDC